MDTLRIGTRGSRLAMWQAEHVAQRLRALPAAPAVEIVRIRTEGDRIQDVPLSAVAGKAFFTKEIEQALLEQRVDLAVHSLKDLATIQPPGLTLGAVLEREDPRDALLAKPGTRLDSLASGARVGTSSLRRRALLKRWRDDLEVVDLRGNVPTRVAKLEAGEYEAIVLAAAGVKRLGLEVHISEYLPLERFPPAVSQGAVAVQVRGREESTGACAEGRDGEVLDWVRELEHEPTRLATTAERALLRRLEGGCQVPVGALARGEGGRFEIHAVVASLDGRRAAEGRRSSEVASLSELEELGSGLAGELLDGGAREILHEIRRADSP